MNDTNPSQATLRLLETADDAAYRKLWVEALTSHGQFLRTSLLDEVTQGISTAFTSDSFTLGAFRDGALVGITSLRRDSLERLRHKALLFRMFVHPGASGHGIGKLLVRELLVRAEAVGDLRQIYLTVLATNERAQRLYASMGFRGYANEPDAVQIGSSFVAESQMVRFLRRGERKADLT